MRTVSESRRRLHPLPTGKGGGEGGERAAGGDHQRHRPPFDRRVVSEFTATRLSIYKRCLAVLDAEGIQHVSSQDFARRFDLNSAQIRKDLATFGEFGVRGVGYEVSELQKHLTSILGLDRTRRVIIVGAGHLGQALADYGGFRSGGFAIAALFDNDARKIGTRTRTGVEVRDVAELAQTVDREAVEIGVIAVPASAAPSVSRRCVAAGLKALLNFAPVRLNPPAGVRVKNVDLKINLETLAFYLPSPPTKGASA
jgi:redox-sensing transcriptional repressor